MIKKLIRLIFEPNITIRGLIAFSEAIDKENLVEKVIGIHKMYGLMGSKSITNFYKLDYSRIFGFYDIFKKTYNIEGDIVECGVGYGKSLLLFSFIINFLGHDKKIYGFDSFEGFPEPSIFDESKRKPQKGEWGFSSEIGIKRLFYETGMIEYFNTNVKLIKGFFNETLTASIPNRISFLHLDCDIYDSYKECLNVCYPNVVKGGYIIFDEYKQEKWPGATKAINDFFLDKEENIQYFDSINRYGVIKVN